MPPTRLVLLGDPVAHSLSPAIQNAALAAAGVNARYEVLRVSAEDLEKTVRALVADNAAGNVTVPHKEAMFALCEERTTVAKRVGAVNTFWAHDGKLVGDNTDVGGFVSLVKHALGTIPRGIDAAVFGAGGSAAAVVAAISGWPGARARVYNRTAQKAEALVERFGDAARAETSARTALAGANLVVNATSVGMLDDRMPLDLADVSKGTLIVDLVYGRNGTPLTRAASARGFTAVDGKGMLVEQAALAFERWFGFAPDREVMRAAMG